MSADRVHAADVECPTCGAWVGWACQGRHYGYHAASYHPTRQRSAENAAAAKKIDLPTTGTKGEP